MTAKAPTELLADVLAAFDEQIATLESQRAEVAGLLERLGADVPPAVTRPPSPPAGRPPTPAAEAAKPKMKSAAPTAAAPRQQAAKSKRSNPVKCPVCGRVCSNGTGLAAHMRNAHPPETRPTSTRPAPAAAAASSKPVAGSFKCGDCDRVFPNVDRLSDHVWTEHNMRALTDAEKAGGA